MIKQVVLELRWLPSQVGSLFVDNIDYNGLEYWYETVQKMLRELAPKPKKNNKK